MPNHPKISVIYEIDATSMLVGQNVNFKYCQQRASYAHTDACEFIFFTGWRQQLEIAQQLSEMRNFGCTEEFVKSIKMAIDSKARWALFYTV